MIVTASDQFGTRQKIKQKVNLPLEIVWKTITQKTEMRHWYFAILDFELKLKQIFHFFEPGWKEIISTNLSGKK